MTRSASTPQFPESDWAAVVARIRNGDREAEEILYRTLNNGARFFLQRRLGIQDVEDRVHDVFLIVTSAIRRGEIDHPERLMGFVRTVLYRQLSGEAARSARLREEQADVDTVAQARSSDSSPEERAIAAEKLALMTRILREMSARDFEILTRFYLRDQPAEEIRNAMGITQVQYQLLKSRAKARFAELARQRLKRA